jgi:hypothetical protein
MTLQKMSAAVGIALLCGTAMAAQSTTAERHEKTKVEVKDGKAITVKGCLERGGDEGYLLTSAEGGLRYVLVSENDLSKYVGRRVEVRGNAADRGDGKVKEERKVEGTTGETTRSKVEEKGRDAALPYLGLKSIKTLSKSCR